MSGDAVRVTVSVAVPPERAFHLFTAQIDRWWKHGRAYRVAGRNPGVLRFECRVGGRLYERFETNAGHREHVAGQILAWEPPGRLLFEWRGVNFRDHERTEVEVLFEPASRGTRLTLVHRGFAALPADHPVRHGKPPKAFIAELGRWWASLLGSLRAWAPEVPVPKGLRFVVLHHVEVDEPNYDVLFETSPGSPLLSWRAARWPLASGDYLVRTPDHRPEWLTREGEVSGGRGTANRVAAGTCSHVRLVDGLLEVTFSDGVELLLTKDSPNEWFCWVSGS